MSTIYEIRLILFAEPYICKPGAKRKKQIKSKFIYDEHAPSGNRTRGQSMGSFDFTTKPRVRLTGFVRGNPFIWPSATANPRAYDWLAIYMDLDHEYK